MDGEIQQIFVTNGRDWLALIVECAVPVVIMIITLIVSRIQQSRALKQQAKESKQQLEQQAKEHAQEMLVQKDVLRLSMKPPFKSCQAAITLLPSRASLGFPAIGMRRRCPSTVSTPICTKTGRTTRADKTS